MKTDALKRTLDEALRDDPTNPDLLLLRELVEAVATGEQSIWGILKRHSGRGNSRWRKPDEAK